MTQMEHPIVRARREAKRGSPQQVQRLRAVVESVLGIRIDVERLSAEDCGELVRLTEKAIETEEWEQPGRPLFRPTRLSKSELQRWRALVGEAAGRPGLLDELDEDAKLTAKLRELAARGMSPLPARFAAPMGACVLPASVWEAVLAGELLAIDLCVLGAVAFAFQGAALHPKTMKRRDAVWNADGYLVIRDGLHRVLPEWSERIEPFGDAVGVGRTGIERRLAAGGWLDVQRHSGREVAVRPGPRFSEE